MTYPQRRDRAKAHLRKFSRSQPAVMEGFGALGRAGSTAGALDAKTKELLALAIAVSDRCDDCIAFHTHDALKAGATRAEIEEVLGVVVYMGGGPSLMYATHALEALEQFETSGDS